MSTTHIFEHVSPYSQEVVAYSPDVAPSANSDAILAILFFLWIFFHRPQTHPQPVMIEKKDVPSMAHGEPDSQLDAVASVLSQSGQKAKNILAKLVPVYPDLTKRNVNSCLFKLLGKGLAAKTTPAQGAPTWTVA